MIHEFPEDFYGQNLGVVVCGYLRDEKNYESLEALKGKIYKKLKLENYVTQSKNFATNWKKNRKTAFFGFLIGYKLYNISYMI